MINLTVSVYFVAHVPLPVEPPPGPLEMAGFSGLRKDGAAAHPWDWVAEDSFYVARPLCLLFFSLEKKGLKKNLYSSAAVKTLKKKKKVCISTSLGFS